MNGSELTCSLGTVSVVVTNGRGASVEEIAERALNKIISVGGQTHPVIRDQALAFKDNIRAVLEHYMAEAVKSDRTTIAARLREAGHPELVSILLEK